jgi:hypothetical protein
MSFWDKLVEERINQALAQGAFDNLPLSGQALKLEDDSHIAAELRLAHKILANAGYVPEAVELRRQITRLEELLPAMTDEKILCQAMRRMDYLKMKLESCHRVSPALEDARYAAKVAEKFSRPSTQERKND